MFYAHNLSPSPRVGFRAAERRCMPSAGIVADDTGTGPPRAVSIFFCRARLSFGIPITSKADCERLAARAFDHGSCGRPASARRMSQAATLDAAALRVPSATAPCRCRTPCGRRHRPRFRILFSNAPNKRTKKKRSSLTPPAVSKCRQATVYKVRCNRQRKKHYNRADHHPFCIPYGGRGH